MRLIQPPGECADNPGTSCLAIKDAGASQGDGTYWIKPPGASDAFEVACDMTLDGGGWTRFNWVKAPYPGGADPLGQTLAECKVADPICRGRIPAGLTVKDLLVRDLQDNQFAAWHFDSANATSNAARAAFQSKTISFVQNGVAWGPYTHNSGEAHCGLGNCESLCDSFYYTDTGGTGQPQGVFGLLLDGDTGWGCAAFKMGATNVPTSDDYGFLNNSGIRDEFGELYFR